MACCTPSQVKDRYTPQDLQRREDDRPEEGVVWKDALGRMRVGHGADGNIPGQASRVHMEQTEVPGKAQADSLLKEPEPEPYPQYPSVTDLQAPAAVEYPSELRQRRNLSEPPSSRAGGYEPTKEELLDADPDGMEPGQRWSIRKLLMQLRDSIVLDGVIFVGNEIASAIVMEYWRPVAWSVAWIVLTTMIGIVGLLSLRYRNTHGLIIFLVLTLMFSILNLQHLNMSHSEAVRACGTPQADFRHCNVPALAHCITKDQCKVEEMAAVDPPCHAPGQKQCDKFATMDWFFWVNQAINFFAYSEPCWWAVMVILRIEISTQSEGEPNTTAFQRLLRSKEMPLVEAQQGYNYWGAVFISFAGVVTILSLL